MGQGGGETPKRRKPEANAIKLPSFYYCKKDEEWRGVVGNVRPEEISRFGLVVRGGGQDARGWGSSRHRPPQTNPYK